MDGIIVVNKEKEYTSRDVVNIVSKVLGTKKVGHTGTLDPLATGVLVLCVGKGTRFVEIITATEKEYIATAELGTQTDTLDSTGTILMEKEAHFSKEELENILFSFNKTYLQEVPKYAAVKVQGKKLYEYAREGKEVELPKREVTVQNMTLLNGPTYERGKTCFTFSCLVSKGTYIRSLIRDLAQSLQTTGIMTDLKRTRQGTYKIEDAYTLDDIQKGEYKIVSIKDILSFYPWIEVEDDLAYKVKNGSPLENVYKEDAFVFVNTLGQPLALYRKDVNNEQLVRPWKML